MNTLPAIIRAKSRLGVIQRHLNVLALKEEILFPKVDVVPTTYWGYSIQMDVIHDEKIISFVTESLTLNDKKEVYLVQKRMMREMYPNYMILEKHS
jgi:hypothetical protein